MKKEENYIKRGGKGLKNASFWAINSKRNSRGGLPFLYVIFTGMKYSYKLPTYRV